MIGEDNITVTYVENEATNGRDKYSYPAKMVIIENTTDNLVDLQNYVSANFTKDLKDGKFANQVRFKTKSGKPFSFGILIIDDYNNVLDSETDTICEINQLKSTNPLINETTVDVENNIAKLTNGIAIFTRVSIVEKSNKSYSFYVSYSGNRDFAQLNKTFEIFIEKCGRGEIFNEKRCIDCEENFYSLEAEPELLSLILNRTVECDTCPLNADCPGGDRVIPFQGFWRLSENTSAIVKCFPPESCPVQKDWIKTGLTNLQFTCATGYAGNNLFFLSSPFSSLSLLLPPFSLLLTPFFLLLHPSSLLL